MTHRRYAKLNIERLRRRDSAVARGWSKAMADEQNDDGVDDKIGAERGRLVGMLHELADRMAQARQERITESVAWVRGGR